MHFSSFFHLRDFHGQLVLSSQFLCLICCDFPQEIIRAVAINLYGVNTFFFSKKKVGG